MPLWRRPAASHSLHFNGILVTQAPYCLSIFFREDLFVTAPSVKPASVLSPKCLPVSPHPHKGISETKGH